MVILRERSLIPQALAILKNSEGDYGFKFDLEELVCNLLTLAKLCLHDSLKFNEEVYYEATISPKIFQNLIKFIDLTSSNLEEIFNNIVTKFNVEEFPFKCLRAFFYRINFVFITRISDQYTEDYYELLLVARKLKGFENMKYLMLNTESQQIR